jgi:hypothetical protein
MNKLTAEVARQDLNHLKSWVETCGISMKEERYMQALEIALPILEQQERGEGDWKHWNGEMAIPPVESHAFVEVKRRNGDVSERQAQEFAWRNSPAKSGNDIIAYRIIPERATNQNGEQ